MPFHFKCTVLPDILLVTPLTLGSCSACSVPVSSGPVPFLKYPTTPPYKAFLSGIEFLITDTSSMLDGLSNELPSLSNKFSAKLR